MHLVAPSIMWNLFPPGRHITGPPRFGAQYRSSGEERQSGIRRILSPVRLLMLGSGMPRSPRSGFTNSMATRLALSLVIRGMSSQLTERWRCSRSTPLLSTNRYTPTERRRLVRSQGLSNSHHTTLPTLSQAILLLSAS